MNDLARPDPACRVVTCRVATASDCRAVAAVNLRSLRESFPDEAGAPDGDDAVEQRAAIYRDRFAAGGFYRLIVAEAEGEGIVGFVDVGAPRDPAWKCDAEIYAFYVLRAFQRQGVGGRLFEAACAAVAAAGMTSAYVIVLERNRYQAFYERCGGRLLARRPAGAVDGQHAHRIYAWFDLATFRPASPALAALLTLIAADDSPAALMVIPKAASPAAPSAVSPDPIDLDEPQWRRVVTEAYRHGVMSIVHRRLRAAPWRGSVPASVLHDFERVHFRVGLDNLRLFGQLGGVLRLFAGQKIDVVVLKGACLAETAYADRALRSMADADLLVRRDDLSRARAALLAAGWRQPLGDSPVDAGGHQLPTFELGGSQIEIHWNIEDERSPFAIDVDGLWQRARQATIGGAPARVLSDEDLLLHVCLHASYNHGWLPYADGLRPLCDVAAIVTAAERRGTPLDWDVVVRRAEQWGSVRCTWLTLRLARELVRARVPAHAIERLAPRNSGQSPDAANGDGTIVRSAVYLMLEPHYVRVARELPSLSHAWLALGWHERGIAARCLAHLLPDAHALRAAYPSLTAHWLAPARYAAHWGELARDLGRLALSRAGQTLRARERERIALTRWMETVDRA